jgi:hypothetical protein
MKYHGLGHPHPKNNQADAHLWRKQGASLLHKKMRTRQAPQAKLQ